MQVRAVLFDLGHTLVFEAQRPEEDDVYDRVAHRVGPLLDTWGVSVRLDTKALVRDLYQAIREAEPQREALGYDVGAPLIAWGVLAAHGVKVGAKRAKTFWNTTFLGLDALGWRLYPDTLKTLRRVHSLGVPVGVVSNSPSSSEVHCPDLATMGITEELVGAFVFSADVNRVKPHPKPFRRALDLLRVEPSNTVFVGDELRTDIRGAKALGMTTVWKLNGRPRVPPVAEVDHTIDDLRELFALGLLPGSDG